MRGKLSPRARFACSHGITPAHAGKTAHAPARVRRGRDHPRACGENSRLSSCAHSVKGSPPRMRGKLVAAAAGPALMGITPAHAGKTRPLRRSSRGLRDHPRACGENYHASSSPFIRSGSPPRMRGKLRGKSLIGSFTGITPAHAGKTAAV